MPERSEFARVAGEVFPESEVDRADWRCDLVVLTAQQYAILLEFVREPNDQRIARRFGLSPQTVRNHLARIQRRLHVSGRVELMKAAVLALLDLDLTALVKTTKEASGNSY
jgi:DNA-binding CsgD family transcriptional regulator